MDGGGHGADGFVLQQRSGLRILGEQEGQRRRAGPRESDADELRPEFDLVDLRVAPVPVLDLEPLAEVADDPRIEEPFAGRVQLGFLVECSNEDFEPLAKGIVAEIVEAGLLPRGQHQVVSFWHLRRPS